VIPAPTTAGLVAYYCDEGEDGETAWSHELVVALEAGDPPAGWIVDGATGRFVRADSIEGFRGYGWQPPVVAAVPGRGWRVKANRPAPALVETWAVRADGSMVATVVDADSIVSYDPAEDDVSFIASGDDDTP
jgi:hypothetical protein